MKIKLTAFLLFISCSCRVAAQKETNNWFFSSNQGVSFNSGSLQTINGIPASNSYGNNTVVCSDENGNVNFICSLGYPGKVYDRNYAVMPGPVPNGNALLSRPLWAKYPGSVTKYFIFYPVATTTSDSCYLKYAIVDMSLNGGLGQVIITDVIVDSSLSVGFCLLNKKGSEDFWIVSNNYGTNNFYSRLVSVSGVSAQRNISVAGLNAIPSEYIFREMKASPDGKLIAGATNTHYPGLFGGYTCDFFEVFNFNSQTGVVSNKVKLPRVVFGPSVERHLEFSPDNKLIYADDIVVVPGLQPCGFSSSKLYQYDLCYTDSISFSQHSTLIASEFFFCSYPVWGNLQLGSDKQIYMKFTGNTLSVIKYPNRRGNSCGFNFNSFTTSSSSAGVYLPDFYQHEIEKPVKNNIVYTGSCYPTPLNFAVTNDTIAHIDWSFGDPASGAQNTSNALAPAHIFSAPGIYTVTAVLFNSNNSVIETISEKVEVIDPSIMLLPADTILCGGNTLKLKVQAVNSIVEWSDQNAAPGVPNLGTADSIIVNAPGTYYVHLIQNGCNGCELFDTIQVNILPAPAVNLGADIVLCAGDSVRIGILDNLNNISCIWSTGETADSIWVSSAGQYWVKAEISNNGCVKYDTINVTINPAVNFSLPADTTLCSGQSLLLNATTAGAQYLWQNNSTAATFNVTAAGLYWVTVTVNGCSKTDSINVNIVNAPQVNLGRDTSLCIGNTLILQAGITGAQYIWSTGAVTPSIQVSNSGQFWVKVSTNNCWASDTINVQFNPVPVFSFGADTVLCNDKSLILTAPIAPANYLWQDNSTMNWYNINQAGLYWLEISSAGCSFRDSLNVTMIPSPPLFLGNDTSICVGAILHLNATGPSINSWLWQDNSTSPTFDVSSPGIYFTEVTAVNGCKKKDSITVNLITLPLLDIGNDTTLCSGKSLRLNTNITGLNHLWSNGSTGTEIIVNTAGLYWVQIDKAGCYKRDSINIAIKNSPVVNLGKDTLLCSNNNLLLDATNNNSSYLWQDGSILPVFLVNTQGIYSVEVDQAGCIERDTIVISYKSKPVFSLGADVFICEGKTILLDPGIDGVNYLWQDGNISRYYTVKQPGLYSVAVSNECGSVTDSINIHQGACDLYIPISFTPNGDGNNDAFKVKFDKPTSYFNLKIYNRYGLIVFETDDKLKGWDGKFKGQTQPMGTYIYVVKYSLQSNMLVNNQSGTIILIR